MNVKVCQLSLHSVLDNQSLIFLINVVVSSIGIGELKGRYCEAGGGLKGTRVEEVTELEADCGAILDYRLILEVTPDSYSEYFPWLECFTFNLLSNQIHQPLACKVFRAVILYFIWQTNHDQRVDLCVDTQRECKGIQRANTI